MIAVRSDGSLCAGAHKRGKWLQASGKHINCWRGFDRTIPDLPCSIRRRRP